jgi:hypothetical protein
MNSFRGRELLERLRDATPEDQRRLILSMTPEDLAALDAWSSRRLIPSFVAAHKTAFAIVLSSVGAIQNEPRLGARIRAQSG